MLLTVSTEQRSGSKLRIADRLENAAFRASTAVQCKRTLRWDPHLLIYRASLSQSHHASKNQGKLKFPPDQRGGKGTPNMHLSHTVLESQSMCFSQASCAEQGQVCFHTSKGLTPVSEGREVAAGQRQRARST